jgi:uncharacterized membrane protein
MTTASYKTIAAAALVLAGCVAGSIAMARAPESAWTAAAVLGPMLGLTVAWLCRSGRRVMAGGTIVMAGLVAWAVMQGRLRTEHLYLAQHVLAHAALAAWFGSSPSGTPLIVQVARRVHRLTPTMHAYATNVTRAWTIYFVAMAVASLLIYAVARFEVWTFFATVATPLSVVAMFVGEHLLRYRLHPEFERVTMQLAVRAWRQGPPPAG